MLPKFKYEFINFFDVARPLWFNYSTPIVP